MALGLRALTDEEPAAIERLAHWRTAVTRMVERLSIIWHAAYGATVPTIARQLPLHEQRVRHWLKRHNAAGLPALDDAPRAGRPATYTRHEISVMIVTALTKPDSLDLPCASWTLNRLEAYLNVQWQIAIKRRRIDELLLAEGLCWHADETWFSERVNPDFAAKREPSNASTLTHQPTVS